MKVPGSGLRCSWIAFFGGGALLVVCRKHFRVTLKCERIVSSHFACASHLIPPPLFCSHLTALCANTCFHMLNKCLQNMKCCSNVKPLTRGEATLASEGVRCDLPRLPCRCPHGSHVVPSLVVAYLGPLYLPPLWCAAAASEVCRRRRSVRHILRKSPGTKI